MINKPIVAPEFFSSSLKYPIKRIVRYIITKKVYWRIFYFLIGSMNTEESDNGLKELWEKIKDPREVFEQMVFLFNCIYLCKRVIRFLF